MLTATWSCIAVLCRQEGFSLCGLAAHSTCSALSVEKSFFPPSYSSPDFPSHSILAFCSAIGSRCQCGVSTVVSSAMDVLWELDVALKRSYAANVSPVATHGFTIKKKKQKANSHSQPLEETRVNLLTGHLQQQKKYQFLLFLLRISNAWMF